MSRESCIMLDRDTWVSKHGLRAFQQLQSRESAFSCFDRRRKRSFNERSDSRMSVETYCFSNYTNSTSDVAKWGPGEYATRGKCVYVPHLY